MAATYWQGSLSGGGPDFSAWTDATNWGAGVPGAGGHAIIHVWGPTPVINSNVGSIGVLTPSWHQNVESSVIIDDGGYLHSSSFTRLGCDSGSYGTLDIMGGVHVTSTLQVGNHADGRGQVNIDRGYLHTAAGGFSGSGQENIDLERGGRFLLTGDRTADVEWWAGDESGKLLSAHEGRGTVKWDYDVTNPGLTTVMVDESPVNRNGGFESIHNNFTVAHRQGVQQPDLNTVSANWGYGALNGLAGEGNLELGGVVPHGDQAAIIFANGAGGASQIWQDLTNTAEPGLWEDGQEYMIEWAEAAGWKSDVAFEGADFTFYLYELLSGGGFGAGHIIGQTLDISNGALEDKFATFTCDLDGGAIDGYRLLLDVRGGGGGGGVYGYTVIDDVYITLIPEPATMLLLGVGGLALLRRRR